MKEVLAGALALPASDRSAFLSRACDSDEMRQRAESLLADANSADAFLEAPALEAAAAILEASRKRAPALTPGRRLGPYEILSPLGAGGMGEVYRARDSKLKRDVAVKVLPADVSEDPERLARFEREAKAVAALSHPNILSIFDFGTQDGMAYAVMELLEGETLRGKLDAGPIPQKQAVDYALQVARGPLGRPRERRRPPGPEAREPLRHQGRPPQDPRLRPGEEGRRPSLPAEKTSAPTGSGHTEPGTVMGTMGYMSPEQVRGLPVDHRSDIFSFGAILYEMLSGKRAFKRDTASDTIAAILKEEPPELSESGRNISPVLDHIVRHCLEKRPERAVPIRAGHRLRSRIAVAGLRRTAGCPHASPKEALRGAARRGRPSPGAGRLLGGNAREFGGEAGHVSEDHIPPRGRCRRALHSGR